MKNNFWTWYTHPASSIPYTTNTETCLPGEHSGDTPRTYVAPESTLPKQKSKQRQQQRYAGSPDYLKSERSRRNPNHTVDQRPPERETRTGSPGLDTWGRGVTISLQRKLGRDPPDHRYRPDRRDEREEWIGVRVRPDSEKVIRTGTVCLGTSTYTQSKGGQRVGVP